MTEMKRRTLSQDVERSVCVWQPSVRMVLAYAWYDPEKDVAHTFVEPVHGIATVIVDHYGKSVFGRRHEDCPPTHRDAVRAGWNYTGRSTVHRPIELVGGSLDCPERNWSDSETHRLCACPWPPGDDVANLAEVFAELEFDCLAHGRRAAKDRAERAARTAPPPAD